MTDLDHHPDLLHFPDNGPGAAARRKRMADINRQDRLNAVSENDFDTLSLDQIAAKHDLPDLDAVEAARVINPMLDRAGERERREEQAEIKRKKTNPLKLARGTDDPVRTQDFARDQVQPAGRLPNPAKTLRATSGTVDTVPSFGQPPKTPAPLHITPVPGSPFAGLDLGDEIGAASGTAGTPATPSNPTPRPPEGFRPTTLAEQGIRIIEAITGESRATLIPRGRQHFERLRDNIVSYSPTETEGAHQDTQSGRLTFKTEDLPGTEATLGNYVDFSDSGPAEAANSLLINASVAPSNGTQRASSSSTTQVAQSVGGKVEERPLPPWFGPRMQRVGKDEQLPEVRVYYQNRLASTASRTVTHNYYYASNNLVETSAVTLRVPPGAWINKRVAETGVPLGFNSGEQFRRFTNLTVGSVRLAIQIRLGGNIADKIKVGIRGSAVSGRKFVSGKSHRGIPFQTGSDLDIFIVSPELIDRFHELGGPKFKKGTKHNMIRRDTKGLERWGFNTIIDDIARQTGRDVSIRVFRNGRDANAAVPSGGPSATLMFDLPLEQK